MRLPLSPPTRAVRCSSPQASALADQRCASSMWRTWWSGLTGSRTSALESGQGRRLGDVDLDACHRQGHIVRSTQLAAALDDSLGAAIDIPISEQDLGHLLHAHPSALDSIAAQDDRVALFEAHPVGERLDRVPDADGTSEAVLERMVRYILGSDDAESHLFGRPRMIL